MRELLIDKSKDFFKILEKEKKEWPAFYFEYVKNAPYIFSGYHKYLGLTDEKIAQRILSFERRFLDKVFQSIGELGLYKYEVARNMVSNSEFLKIDIPNTHLYIVGGLDFDPVIRIDDENMIIDVLSLYRAGFQNLTTLMMKMY